VEIVAEAMLAISGVGVSIVVARIALNKVFRVAGIDRTHSSPNAAQAPTRRPSS
jgi:hypothetical protein